MKRGLIVIALVALFGSLSIQAAPVSPSKALEMAQKIFAAQPSTKATGPIACKLLWDGESVGGIAPKTSVQPAFYVISRDGGGWVIIAGDDNVQPVLGISATGRFVAENMPDNVKWRMDYMKALVRSARSQSPEVKAMWMKCADTKANASISGEVTNKVEKLTPEWDQGNNDTGYGFGENVFNAKCPKVNGALCVAGCVPVALGELLTYESGQDGVTVPASATGTVGGYSVTSGYVAPVEYELGTIYDWAGLRKMTNIKAIKNTAPGSAIRENLAQLIADLGAIVESAYSPNGTGANTNTVIAHMAEHFGINKGATLKMASDHRPSQWIEMLVAELNKRPVLYSGRTERNAGHTFLLDGYGSYDNTTVFHVNFGWGGSNNGYYYITNLDAGYPMNYSYDCSAFFDFYPEKDSQFVITLTPVYQSDTNPGLRLEKTSDGYKVYYCIANFSSVDYDGRVKYAVRKRNGDESVLAVRDFSMQSYCSGGGSFWYVQIPEIDFGDKVVFYYEDGKNTENWKPLVNTDYGTAVYEWPLTPVPFIYTETRYRVGDYFVFRLMNYDRLYAGTVWTIQGPDGGTVKCSHSVKEYQFTKAGVYRIEAALAVKAKGNVTERLVTYITVK